MAPTPSSESWTSGMLIQPQANSAILSCLLAGLLLTQLPASAFRSPLSVLQFLWPTSLSALSSQQISHLLYSSSSLMRHPPSKAVLACPLTAKCNATPTAQSPAPSVGLACLHGPFCCDTGHVSVICPVHFLSALLGFALHAGRNFV